MRVGLAYVVAFALFASTSAAAAGPETLRVGLVVDSAPGCIDAASLAKAVDGVLERDALELSSTAPATIRATIHRSSENGMWQATLSLEARGKVIGTREVVRKGASCTVLDGPLAVVAALLVDVAKDSIKLVVPPPTLPDEVPARSRPPVGRKRAAPWGVETELGATGLAGLLPGIAPGARIEARVRPPGFLAFMLRFDTWPFASSGDGPGGDFRAAAASVGVCPELRGARLGVDGCLSFLVGPVRATGRGVPIPGESISLLALIQGDVGGRLRLAGPIWLHASLGLAWGQRPDDWHFDNPHGQPMLVFTPWPVAVTGSLGLCVDFGPPNRKNAD